MRFRKNDVCDQRRRRVLMEEGFGDTDLDREATVPLDAGAAGQLLPSYTDAALADRRSPITAVIPRRGWTVIVLLLSGLAVIAGIQAAYGRQHLLPREMWASDFSAFDVQAPGGLAAWFCSLILAVAAFQGFQIYRLRRHKTDDYRGRYRVWLWVPLVLFFMATGVATHIHHDLANLASGFTNITASADSGPLWPLVYCVLWTLVSLRLAFEVRKSRASQVSLLLATCCYFAGAFAVLFADLAVGAIGEMNYVMATTTIGMLGHLATFLTVAIYGRHVYMDSQGMLPVRESKASRKKSKKNDAGGPNSDERDAASKDASRERAKVIPISAARDGTDSKDSASGRTKKRRSQAKNRGSADKASPKLTLASDTDPEDSPDDSGGDRKLSKAERRRLRKQKRREQRGEAA